MKKTIENPILQKNGFSLFPDGTIIFATKEKHQKSFSPPMLVSPENFLGAKFDHEMDEYEFLEFLFRALEITGKKEIKLYLRP